MAKKSHAESSIPQKTSSVLRVLRVSLAEQLAQRNAELAIINSIQAALAAKLDMHAIYDLVGEKIREIAQAEVVYIAVRSPLDSNQIDFPYYVDRGSKINAKPLSLGEGLTSRVINDRRMLLLGTLAEQIGYGVVFEAQERANTYLGIPILTGDFVVGVVSVQSYRENAFNDSDIRLFSTLASSMGVALENARLLEETRRRSEQLTTLAEIGRDVSATLDLTTVLERIASHTLTLYRARDVVLRLLEPGGSLPAVVAIGKYAEIYQHWNATLGQGLSGSIAKSGLAEIINDPQNDPRVIDIPGTEEDQATRAILFAPMRIGEQIIGVLSVWRDKLEVGPFTLADLNFSQDLARQAAIAIQNARLFAETQQRFKETEILRAANVALTRSLDLDTVLGVLLDYLQQVVPYDTGSVFLLEDEKHLTALAARGYEHWVENSEKAVGIRFEYKNIPHIRTVIEDQTTLIIPDVTRHPGWIVAETAGHVRNWLAVPLVVGNKTIGMYSLDKVQPGYFTHEHQRLAENLAAQAAIAFQNATLFRSQQVARQQSETLRAAAQALGSTLSLRQVFELILTELRKVVPYDSCSVQQLDGDSMVIVGGHGFPNLDELLGNRFDWHGPDDPAGDVVRQRKPIIIADVSARFEHFKDETHGQGRVHGWMGVPLLFGERLIGMITLDKLEKDFYSTEHAQMAKAFAAQAATAIENARLFDETQRLLKETKETKDVTETLYNITQVLGKTLNLQDIFDVILGELQKVVPYDSSSVQVIQNNRLVIVGGRGFENLQALLGVGFDLDDETNPSVRAVRSKRQQVFGDVSSHPHFMSQIHGDGKIRGWIGAPLIFGERVIGVITLDKFEPDFYNDRLAELVMAFAAQAAVSIENARLFETERIARQQAETLRAAAQALGSTLNLQQVFDLILSELRKVVPYDSCSVQQLDGNNMIIVGGHGFPNLEELIGNSFDWRGLDDPAGDVVRRREPVIIEDVSARFKHFKDETHGRGRVHGWLGVPLLFGERLIGMLTLDKLEMNFYTQEHARMAQAFATQAATAIENARLFDETKSLLEETRKAKESAETQSRRLNSLNLVAQAVSSTRDLTEILEIAAREMVSQLVARSCGVTLINAERTHMTVIAFAGQPGEASTVGTTIQLDGNPGTQQVIATRQALVIGDAQNSPLQNAETREVFKTKGTTSILIMPLIVRDEVVGTFGTNTSIAGRVFTTDDVELASTIASQISGAIENARLFDETQRLLKITEDHAAELAIINSVQAALASELNIQGIYDAVGDKIREIFRQADVGIRIHDPKTNLVSYPYIFENGKRISVETELLSEQGITPFVLRARETLVINENMAEAAAKYGAVPLPGTLLPKSQIFVPLFTGNQAHGIIDLVDMENEHAFSDSDVRLLTTLANAMSVALENARLFDETQRLFKVEQERVAELQIINSIQQGLASELDFYSIIEVVGDELRKVFQTLDLGIDWYDEKTNLIHYLLLYERGQRLEVSPQPPRPGGVMENVLKTHQPVLLNNLADYAKLNSATPVPGTTQGKSYIAAPIITTERVVGLIGLEDFENENAFGESELRLLTTIAASLGTALENARLFDETQRLLKITEERAQELAILNSVGEAMAKTLDVKTVTKIVGDKVRDIFGAEVTEILLRDANSDFIHVPYAFAKEYQDVKPFAIGDGLTSKIILSGKPLVLDTFEQVVELGALMPTEDDKTESYMGVPIVAGEKLLGVVSVQSYQRHAYNQNHVHLLQTLSSNMGVAIENARLFDETQRLLKITEERAQELSIINSVQEGLASKLIMQAIYDLIGDKIRDIFDAQVVDIGVYDRNEKLLHFPYTIERGERFPDEPMKLIGFRKHAMETHQPLLVNQNLIGMATKYGNPVSIQGETSKAALYVPMLVGGEAIGVISLQNLDHEDAFSESAVSLLTTLTNAMSVALENARLFDETQRLLRVTEERAAELSAIGKVSQALIVESELDNTIQLIGNQMREIFSADIVYLALLDTKTNLIHFPYQYGEAFTTLTLGQGLTSKIIQTGEPLLINQDVVAQTAAIGVTRVGKEALSYLGVPIKTGKGTIGVISVQSTTKEGLFNDDSLRLLTTIAANAGAALHNAQLFSEALENLRQVEILTNAASAIEHSAYEPAMIESVAARTDALGELARVFRKMADEVRLREQRLKRQLAQMQLDIEEKKLAKAETVAIYVSMDRRQAMAEHLTLPERAHGTALFADVSGFTALTESLANELGLQRGAEEMIRHLNRVLTALTDEVHRYSGAVINFSGDAITCWFDDLDLHGYSREDSAVERAAACAFAMQKDMTKFAAINAPNGKTIGLSIKVALAAGPTRRMMVGNGNVHQIDVLAGATLNALAEAEHVAEKGEIVFSAAGFSDLEEKFSISSWREGRQFAVLSGLKKAIAPSPWPELGEEAILKSRLRPWMHPAVFEKVRAGQSEMLSELRPATALFMKFGGLDYDKDPEAEKKLKVFIQWVEQVIAPHHGAIIQFTVGDKGSYIYIVFGAPIAHMDDTVQAVFTAMELAALPDSLAYMTDLFIGLASGQMRVGAYGGASHRTYGAIGDRTNLAARLMVAASRSSVEIPAGQRALVFCNDSVYEDSQSQVEFETLPSIMVKGKSKPIAIYRPLRKLAKLHTESGITLDSAQLIDQLSSAEQLTLKVASVIGQFFTLEAVAAIYPEKQTRENLQKHLQNLTGLDLIVKRPGETSGYNFKDAQTHAAAYNLMLFAQRRQLHHTLAELLEQTLFNVPPYAEIAHHWQAADEIPKAIEYLEKAGEHARQMGDFEAATHFFNKSLGLNN